MTKPAFFKYEKYYAELRKKAEKKMDNKYYWIWLSLAFGSSANSFSDKLLHEFGYNAENIYNATEEMLLSTIPDNERLVKKLSNKNMTQACNIIMMCEQQNIGILTPGCALYPKSLNSIPAKPLVLYYKGCIPDLGLQLCVSVVGTRKVSQYGSNSAYTISYDLAKSGAIVVSGMAAGTDGIAHRGALDAMGKTVAVLGSGIDVIYPRSNADLYKELILNGLILSEYPPGTPPDGWHFPQRNRIISGLSSATLVVEAAEKSGALITAEQAKKQGRLLYAVPGKVGEYSSLGTNQLIRTGAKMTTCANDILTDFYPLYPNLKLSAPSTSINVPTRTVARPQRASAVQHSMPIMPPMDDNSSEFLSIEVDPRLEAARKQLAKRIQIREGLNLTYPSEALTSAGYKVSSYWEPRPKTRKLPVLSEDMTEEAVKTKENKTIPSQPKRVSAPQKKQEATTQPAKPTIDLDSLKNEERRIVEYLMEHTKSNMDQLTATGLKIHEIMGAITLLEIRGIVKALSGGCYTLNSNNQSEE